MVSSVYLLTTRVDQLVCGRPIRRSRSVAHVLGKLQIECVYLLIADVTHHKRRPVWSQPSPRSPNRDRTCEWS